MKFAFVAAVEGIGFEYVAVTGFQLFKDAAFVDNTGAAVVGECAEKNGVFTIPGVEGTELGEVFAEQCVSLCLGHQVQPGEPYRRGVQLTDRQADALLRKDLRKFCALYSQYGKDSILLACLAYNCGPGVVNKSTVLKKLKAGNRNIFKAYTAHCRYKGKFHKQLYQRRITEYIVLFN